MRKIYYLNTKDAVKVKVSSALALRIANRNVKREFGDKGARI